MQLEGKWAKGEKEYDSTFGEIKTHRAGQVVWKSPSSGSHYEGTLGSTFLKWICSAHFQSGNIFLKPQVNAKNVDFFFS